MNLAEIYEAYIACLDARDLTRLDEYVADSVIYNGSMAEVGLKLGPRHCKISEKLVVDWGGIW